MRVRAMKRHGYAGVTRNQGTEFVINNTKHAGLLVATGRIKIIENEKSQPEKKIEMSEDTVVKNTKAKCKSKKQKRKQSQTSFYSRKDMIADDNKTNGKKRITYK